MYIYGTYNYSYWFCLTKTHKWGGHIISVHYQFLFYPMAVNSSTIPLDSNFFWMNFLFFAKFWMKSQFSWHLDDEIPIFMAKFWMTSQFSWHAGWSSWHFHDIFTCLFWRQPVSGLVKHQAARNRIPVRQLGKPGSKPWLLQSGAP